MMTPETITDTKSLRRALRVHRTVRTEPADHRAWESTEQRREVTLGAFCPPSASETGGKGAVSGLKCTLPKCMKLSVTWKKFCWSPPKEDNKVSSR